jgi:polyisoprenoid-binding protein YceI
MRKLKTTALAIGMIAFATLANAQDFKVNKGESSVKWHAKKVTGEHFGTANVQEGVVQVANNKLTGGRVVVDMTSIDATDLTGEWKDKLVGHLKSDDFFSTAQHGTATLVIKSATPIQGAKPGRDNYNVVADLTIKGITQEVKFPAMVAVAKGKVTAFADINIDRTKYDIKYGSKSIFADIGDKAINDDFNIKVKITALQ